MAVNTSNTVIKAILDRRSTRSFENRDLTQEEIEQLRQAVMAVPTAMNLQELKFTFILNHNIIEELSLEVVKQLELSGDTLALERIRGRHTSVFYGAPLLIIISAPADSHYGHVDGGIAVQTLALAAQGMGLGSCIIGMAGHAFTGSRSRKYRDLAHIPQDHDFIISIAVGHPAISKEAHENKPENITFVR